MARRDRRKWIFPPEGGWKAQTWYLVDVAFNRNNPVHRALFFTGFLQDRKPARYNMLAWCGYDRAFSYDDVMLLRALRVVAREEEFRGHGLRLPEEYVGEVEAALKDRAGGSDDD